MRNKNVLLIVICLAMGPAILIKIYAHYSDNAYVPEKPPAITAVSLKSLSTILIQSQEDFNGAISIEPQLPNQNKANITFVNNYSGGDSVGAIEYKMIAEKKGELWTITESKSHWKCSRDILFGSFWTTSSCP